MTEETVVEPSTKRATWIGWMHVAGVGYAVAVWLLGVSPLADPASMVFVGLGGVALTVATIAFIGGWGRYLQTKK